MATDRITVVNDVDMKVKVCIYKGRDVDWVPCEGGVFFLDYRGKNDWTPSSNEKFTNFDVVFFKPALFDERLVAAQGVILGSTVTLHETNGTYWVEVKGPA